ncbi:MAG: PrsW family intramembrane metalloprotease [Polyangiaceae bacterium]|nr:PrsW family intramembrane metalloprotease [Polyangiaceae bacterium]
MKDWLIGIAVCALPLGAGAFLWLRLRRAISLSRPVAITSVLAGFSAAWAAYYLQLRFWGWTGLSLQTNPLDPSSALFAMFLFAAPVEEGIKTLAVWPLYVTRRLDTSQRGMALGGLAGAGFAAGEILRVVAFEGLSNEMVLRLVAAAPGHVFFAGCWAYFLGGRLRTFYYPSAWMVSMLLHGVYSHIVFGRGPGYIVAVLPMLAVMAWVAYGALRDITPEPLGPLSRTAPLLALAEAPSLREMRRALRRTDQPLMLHWVVVGGLVTVGIMMVSLAGAVYLGHQVGIDFAAASEADVTSNGPLVLLGSAVLGAFPCSGYLVARASGTTSVLEPAMGAALALVAVVAMLSVTAPIAIIFALATAPIAFGLACGGAWLGVAR